MFLVGLFPFLLMGVFFFLYFYFFLFKGLNITISQNKHNKEFCYLFFSALLKLLLPCLLQKTNMKGRRCSTHPKQSPSVRRTPCTHSHRVERHTDRAWHEEKTALTVAIAWTEPHGSRATAGTVSHADPRRSRVPCLEPHGRQNLTWIETPRRESPHSSTWTCQPPGQEDREKELHRAEVLSPFLLSLLRPPAEPGHPMPPAWHPPEHLPLAPPQVSLTLCA